MIKIIYKICSTFHVPRSTFCASRKGFTLIEVLVASTIFVVVIGIAISSFSSSASISRKNDSIREVSQTGKYIIESISRTMRLATDNPATTGKVDPFILSKDGNTLTADVELDGGEETYRYDPDSKKIFYSDYKNPSKETSLTPDNIAVDYFDENTKSIFSKNVYYDKTIKSDPEAITTQPTLRIKFKLVDTSVGKGSEGSVEYFETSVATRTYPGFNKP